MQSDINETSASIGGGLKIFFSVISHNLKTILPADRIPRRHQHGSTSSAIQCKDASEKELRKLLLY
jgi:hypothetical protein